MSSALSPDIPLNGSGGLGVIAVVAIKDSCSFEAS
jgi:hypothetical protein